MRTILFPVNIKYFFEIIYQQIEYCKCTNMTHTIQKYKTTYLVILEASTYVDTIYIFIINF